MSRHESNPPHPSRAANAIDRTRRRRLTAAAAVAVTAVLAALPAGDTAGGPNSAAAAASAAEQTAPAQYSYLKLRTGSTGTDDTGGGEKEWWVGADGSGRLLESMTGLTTGETPIGAGWRQTGPGNWVHDRRFGPGEFAAVYLDEAPAVVRFDVELLPTTPRALRTALRGSLREAARDSDPETGFAPGGIAPQAQMLVLIGQVLAHPLASSQLRGTLHAVARRLPRVRVRRNVEDPIRRRGTALSFAQRIGHTTNRHEVIFDPATSQTLATRLASAEPLGHDAESRRFTDYVLFVTRGVVDSPNAAPAPDM